MSIIYILIGLLFLIIGAELLVKGASRFAMAVGISPLIVGLTVVAFGTSSPELAVSIKAVFSNQSNIAVGNIIGSNIFNVLFILGLSALIVPLSVSQQLIRLDVPLMVIVSCIILAFSLDGELNRVEGVVLFLGLITYTCFLIYQSRKENNAIKEEYSREFSSQVNINNKWLKNLAFVLSGLFLLLLGSRSLVDGSVTLAQSIGVSELIIGLTIVAIGTSLPEVVTSIVAAIHGERDIAVGNVIGSNIFNLLGVLGLACILAPSAVEISSTVIQFDLPIMILVAFACLPIFFTGGEISRQEGGLLLAYYLIYILYLILVAMQYYEWARIISISMYVLIPLTIFTSIILVIKDMQRSQKYKKFK